MDIPITDCNFPGYVKPFWSASFKLLITAVEPGEVSQDRI